ncbi:aminodeoxychorismate lyase [Salinisphaera sp.]|uniref:aminodeoxychorismate lyase n=1 Tax=Salinisphaera sp. TaxID=1914330 RepID=UPI002D76F9E4|nr:aminodeoxychorismate lyase [Salinisphaera sp.]HET7314065.1 aminodeoxychorismate lyase [Salinisphaera sp.]
MTETMRIDGVATRQLPADDRGLAYGDGVFRTMRVEAGRVVAWPFHYARLAHDCAALGFAVPMRHVLEADAEALCRESPTGALKIMITRGSGGRGYAAPAEAQPRRIVSLHPAPAAPAALALPVCPVVLATPAPLAGVKHLNRLEQVLARAYCERRNIVDAAMCDSSGRIICTTMRNLILVDASGRWSTPALGRAGVIGATRERLRAAVPDFVERDIKVTELSEFAAVIACNSLTGAVPVTRIGDQSFARSTALAARADALLTEHV